MTDLMGDGDGMIEEGGSARVERWLTGAMAHTLYDGLNVVPIG
jgi:hypothetical protein